MKILGIGTTVVDRVVVMDSYPEADTKKEISDGWIQVGGPVPVALSTAAAFGAKTRLLGRWGNDADGCFIRDTLCRRGIELDFVKTLDDWKSGSAQVWLSQGEGSRTIAFSRGTFPALTSADITNELLADCRILHLDGWASDAAIPAAIKMKEQGGTVVLDAGSVKPGLQQLLPHADVLVASKLFCEAFQIGSAKPTTEIAWASLGIPTVITTHGEDGATLYNSEGIVHIKGHQVDCVDSNGAGDIFSGSVLYGLTQKWSMRRTVEFANEVAANSCTQFGNQITNRLAEK